MFRKKYKVLIQLALSDQDTEQNYQVWSDSLMSAPCNGIKFHFTHFREISEELYNWKYKRLILWR